MGEPIELLKQEHRKIERMLHALEAVCQRIESGQTMTPDAVSPFVHFIRTYADQCHHGKEEVHLFPALVQHGMLATGGPIAVLLYEHELGRKLLAEMDHAIQAWSNGDSEASQRFVSAAGRYVDMLTMHICKEDNIVFHIAEQALDEAAMSSLRHVFEQVDAALGADIQEQFERAAVALETTWTASVTCQ